MSSSLNPIPGRMISSRNCFVCGRDNIRGLRIPFYFDGDRITAEYIPGKELCGFDDTVHGGILSALADEAMMHLIWASDLRAVTAEIIIRFHNQAKIDNKMIIQAEFTYRSDKLIRCQCRLLDTARLKIATAKGKFLPIAKDMASNFKKSF